MKNKKFSKDYYALMRRNKKKILKSAKEAVKDPWDWQPAVSLFVAQLEFMRDYYKNGENVQACEEYKHNTLQLEKSRLGILEEILSEYYEWMHCEEKYYKLVQHPETYTAEELPNGSVRIKDLGSHIEYSLHDPKLTGKAFEEERQFHRKNFFKLLYTYIENLWD